MKSLLCKELRLSSMAITYFFLLFSFMTFLPGYPIVTGSFFVCMGIFYSFQFARESNDSIYMLLLPVSKKQVVKAKYLFVLFLEVTALVIITICTLLRMTLLSAAPVYTENAMMPANFFYIGFCLVSFGLFNAVLVRGYFKTAYKIGVPFLIYCLLEAVVISLSEAVGHFPGLEFFRATDFSSLNAQLIGLAVGAVFFVLVTLFSFNRAEKSFERLDF